MSGVSPEHFDSIYNYKSILTAMDEAGFHTYFFSNQTPNRSFTQFFGEEADSVRYTDFSIKPHPFDHELSRWLAQAVTDTLHPKQFFVIHTYGSHFLYRDRYPEEYSYFKPDNTLDANRANRESLINGYDNSIRYTDNLLADIIDALRTVDGRSALVYSADHGEDIFDDHRNRFLHASPNPTYYQVHVASLVWVNDSIKKSAPEKIYALRQNSNKIVCPQESLFHTALNLADINSPIFKSYQSVASSDYQSPSPLKYVNDLNHCLPLKESGLKNVDIEKIDSIILTAQ